MKPKQPLLIILILFQFPVFTQNNFATIPLSTFDPNGAIEDLRQLDTLFQSSRMIGLGESTHGSSEFTIMRHRLFRYLTENHNYNTFFIEADYGACQRINRYIHGETDTALMALREIKFWTWRTNEMLEIIEWAKIHNEKSSNKITFIGCDMQFIDDDYLEFIRILSAEDLNKFRIKEIFEDLNNDSSDSLIRVRYDLWKSVKPQFESIEQLSTFTTKSALLNGIDQWFESKSINGFDYNFRDSSMALNIISYLKEQSEAKGIYFAHNWHVSNSTNSHNNHYPQKTTGKYLKENLGQEYKCIGLISYDLTFNAKSCIDKKLELTHFHRIASGKKMLERKIQKTSHPLCYINATSIASISKYKITEIGAIYKRICGQAPERTEVNLKEGMFDGFIYFEKTGKTTLLVK